MYIEYNLLFHLIAIVYSPICITLGKAYDCVYLYHTLAFYLSFIIKHKLIGEYLVYVHNLRGFFFLSDKMEQRSCLNRRGSV